jgi:hypothetical protein
MNKNTSTVIVLPVQFLANPSKILFLDSRSLLKQVKVKNLIESNKDNHPI